MLTIESKIKEFIDNYDVSDVANQLIDVHGENHVRDVCSNDFITDQYFIYTTVRSDIDPSYHFNSEQTQFIENRYNAYHDDYMAMYGLNEIDFDHPSFQEYMDEATIDDDAVVMVCIANHKLRKEVHVELYVNYKNGDNCTISNLDLLSKAKYSYSEFMQTDYNDIVTKLKDY